MGRERTTFWIAGLLTCLLVIPFVWSVAASGAWHSLGYDSVGFLTGQGSGMPLLAQETATQQAVQSADRLTPEERLDQLEKTLESIETTGKMAEVRSYQNKMMALQLIGMVRLAVVVLVVIAIGFPLTLVLLSYRRVLKFPGLSPEMADTLVAVEERQVKLVNILKEIQNEIDYVHSLSVPDLKRLIEQAEKYIQQNESDLEKAKSGRTALGNAAAKSESPAKTS